MKQRLKHTSSFLFILIILLNLQLIPVVKAACEYDGDGDGVDDAFSTDPLLGDTACTWGDPDCNSCVYDVEDNFYHISDNNGNPTGHTQLRIEASDDNGELMCQYSDPCELTAFFQHIQGIGRIPNVDENNWFVFTRSIRGGPGAFFAGQMTDLPSAGGHLGSATNEDDLNEDSTSEVVLSKAAQKHMCCEWCNLSGIGNIYITSERNMVLYASEKNDEKKGDINI